MSEAQSNVDVKNTIVEAQNCLGLCEHYRQSLRQAMQKIIFEQTESLLERDLAAVVKAMNDTL